MDFDLDGLAFDVTKLAQSLTQVLDTSRILPAHKTEPCDLSLLRPRRERPRRRCERSYHFPASDSDRHVALPCDGWLVKGTISRRKGAVFTRSADSAA